MSKAKQTRIEVQGTSIAILNCDNHDFISLTDIAKRKNPEHSDDVIRNWLRSHSTVEFLGVWERLNNPGFNPVEFDGIRIRTGLNSFVLTPKQWIEKTGAIKETLIPPAVTPAQANLVYASEADLLNVALFGRTAKQWRDAHPDADGNLRDQAPLEQLVVLTNLESLKTTITPKLRFPEFRDGEGWSEKKLGGVGDVLMCKRVFANETNDSGGVPFYKIGTLGGAPDAYINKELFDDFRSGYNYPRVGEVLITCSGTVGKCLPYDGRDAYYQDSNIVWIDNPTQTVSNEFLLRILTNVNWGKLNSTTITRIYGPDLKGLLIRFPKEPAEQQKIASCLSSLDELIAAELRKLDALKAHKKGLMQQLFPAPEGEA